MIHIESIDCGPPRLSSALDVCSITSPSEVTRPLLSTRIEEEDQAPTDRVSMVRPYAFLEIAASTG